MIFTGTMNFFTGPPAELSIDALQGVSAADAEALQKAFGVKTIRQLAENKFIKAAQAITLLAGAK